jgi:hypothetical protein
MSLISMRVTRTALVGRPLEIGQALDGVIGAMNVGGPSIIDWIFPVHLSGL